MGESCKQSGNGSFGPTVRESDSDLSVDIPGLIECLRGQSASPLAPHPIYCDFRPGVTVVLLDSGEPQKYVVAVDTGGHHYIVSLPLKWFPYHRNILAQVRMATDKKVRCIGGGWIVLVNEALHVYGESIAFGYGNHRVALRAFARAVGKARVAVN